MDWQYVVVIILVLVIAFYLKSRMKTKKPPPRKKMLTKVVKMDTKALKERILQRFNDKGFNDKGV
jgi:hypothetical protein